MTRYEHDVLSKLLVRMTDNNRRVSKTLAIFRKILGDAGRELAREDATNTSLMNQGGASEQRPVQTARNLTSQP